MQILLNVFLALPLILLGRICFLLFGQDTNIDKIRSLILITCLLKFVIKKVKRSWQKHKLPVNLNNVHIIVVFSGQCAV